MTENKITPALWFHTPDGKMSHVLDYYKRVFENDFEADAVVPLGVTPSGNTELCNVSLFGQTYLMMTTETEHHKFNDAISIIINCNDQQEIDRYWNYFTKEGEESQCGWCMDKYGLRWQIVPANMNELMSNPNAGKVMMKQRKIIIAEYFE
ncbi:3-demethylubiquinone-9 3-methyltransferase [anaerobic digester metagenome]